MDDRTEQSMSFSVARFLINCFEWNKIDEWINLKDGEIQFEIYAREVGGEVYSLQDHPVNNNCYEEDERVGVDSDSKVLETPLEDTELSVMEAEEGSKFPNVGHEAKNEERADEELEGMNEINANNVNGGKGEVGTTLLSSGIPHMHPSNVSLSVDNPQLNEGSGHVRLTAQFELNKVVISGLDKSEGFEDPIANELEQISSYSCSYPSVVETNGDHGRESEDELQSESRNPNAEEGDCGEDSEIEEAIMVKKLFERVEFHSIPEVRKTCLLDSQEGSYKEFTKRIIQIS
ncbi:hypothetical protein PIB30_032468 [Stylosanthes scabra]|uniref:Uncharacterized protein n=1 Tax=Stylosanthes scabra TaxID=79078 RepID=A0ABU6TBV1_9FABA|nr:hypothetical protein [Stylosanthes scabra]